MIQDGGWGLGQVCFTDTLVSALQDDAWAPNTGLIYTTDTSLLANMNILG